MKSSGYTLMVAGLLMAVASGCAGSGMEGVTPSATVTTTMPGFTENWFKVEWEVTPDSDQTRRVEGYVYNNYGRPAAFMRLLVQAFDGTDTLVHQQLAWVGSPVPPLSHSYFRIGKLPAADHYRVSVWSYTIQDNGGRWPW